MATVKPVPLPNLGNTCFANAVLQCLCNTGELRAYLTGPGLERDRRFLVNTNPLHAGLLDEMVELMRGTGRPGPIVRLLRVLNRSFAGRQQADAQECLSTLLETLHSALRLNVRITLPTARPLLPAVERALRQQRDWLAHDGYSCVSEMFTSQFRSQLRCAGCGATSTMFDPYAIVPVEIPRGARDLYECLAHFGRPEVLEDRACSGCGKVGETTKQFGLWSLPPVLVLQLKRFDGAMRKVSTPVATPTTLDLTNLVVHPQPATSRVYRLRSIVCHLGGLAGGHYVAKCSTGGAWWLCDDSRVQPLKAAGVQGPENYIMFYERLDVT